MHKHICMCRSEDNLWYCSQVPYTFLRQDLSLGLVPTNVLEWLFNNPQRSTQDSPSSTLGFPACIMPGFQRDRDRWGSNSCTYAYKANPSAPEPSPQPSTSFLNLYSGLTFQGHNELFSNVPKIFPKSMSHVPKLATHHSDHSGHCPIKLTCGSLEFTTIT